MTATAAVRERPILFSGEMVRALLDGRKTQTRRVVQMPPWVREIGTDAALTMFDLVTFDRMQSGYPDGPRPVFDFDGEPNAFSVRNPYGCAGDVLWVRENWQTLYYHHDHETGYCDDYGRADVERVRAYLARRDRWEPAAFGVAYQADPGWESHREDRGFAWRPSIHMPRWASRLTLTLTGVRVERVQDITDRDAIAEGIPDYPDFKGDCPSDDFRQLWDSLNTSRGYGWDVNPWVWVLTFTPASPSGLRLRGRQ